MEHLNFEFGNASPIGFPLDSASLAEVELATHDSPNVVGLVTLALDMHTLAQRVFRIQQLLHERGSVSQPIDQAAMIRGLRRQKPRGIICHLWDNVPEALDELRRYMDDGGHVVCFGGISLDLECDQVRFDAQHSVYEVTRHLIELGHTRIGLLPFGGITPEHPWYCGWHLALGKRGIEPGKEWLMCPDAHGFFTERKEVF